MKIVYCIDENYIPYAKKSIQSVLKFNPKAEVIIVSPHPINIGYKNFVIPINRSFRHRNKDRISDTAYLKLYLTELPYNKIIYIDGDTLCQNSLTELWNLPCEYINICESHNWGKEQAKALGLEKYGNTGVMVMNLKRLRKINFTELCLSYMDIPEPSTGWQHDETLINVALKDKLTFIDKKFNYCHNRKYDNPIEEHNAHILHFIGSKKEMKTEALVIGRSPFVNEVEWDKIDFDRFLVICVNYPVPDIPVDIVVAKDDVVNPVLAPATKFISPNTGYNFCNNPTMPKDIGFLNYTSTSAVWLANKMGLKSYLIGVDHREDDKPFYHYDGIQNHNIATIKSQKEVKNYISQYDVYQTNPTVKDEWDLPYIDIKSLYVSE